MNTIATSETISRRWLLGTVAAVTASGLIPSSVAAAAVSVSDAIRPFRVNIPEEQLADLRRRINATRWPDQETVDDGSQGLQLAKVKEIIRYWGTDYDWRKVEARLNALPMFITEIDGIDIHFIHVRSKHDNALPLIVTHGWPGSIIEQLKIIDPLTNPTAHGGSASDAFHLVIPSIPGFGFSGKPKEKGWGPDRIARAWAELMKRLGYTRYVAQGGDWGSPISSAMARQAAPGLLGIHINLPAAVPSDVAMALAAGGVPAGLSEKERASFNSLETFFKKYMAYGAIMGTRPQAIGYGLADSAGRTRSLDPRLQRRRARAPAQSRRCARQHYDVLADQHGNVRCPHLLGDRRTKHHDRGGAEDDRDNAPGGHHRVPRRGLSGPRDLGAARLPQPRLFQRSREGRALRRLGAARAVLSRSSRRVQITSTVTLITNTEGETSCHSE